MVRAFYSTMNSGTYSPSFRMIIGQTERLEAATENLANCSNPGYRRLQVDHKLFEAAFRDAVQSPGNWEDGKSFDPVSVDFTAGPLRSTSRPTDFAIVNDNSTFFVVEKEGKELYTRNGRFLVDAQGNMTNTDGFAVLGPNGPITIPPNTDFTSLTVDNDGTLRSHGKVVDVLKMASFSDTKRLIRAGTTLFSTPDDMNPQEPSPDAKAVIGALESSNTTVFEEMAEIISCMRAYESCQRMIRNQDEAEGRMIQQLG
jgi:flagellar basal-body rod protein FlgF